MHILTINGSSSNIKFALYQIGKPLVRALHGKINHIACRIQVWNSIIELGIAGH